MELPRHDVDPDGLLEYSVVFSDRALNHMSKKFAAAMAEILGILRETYHADSAVVIPGGGSYAMESVARQFMTDKRVLVVRNGFFSYRWSQIIDAGGITDAETVMKARDTGEGFAPAPIDEVCEAIAKHNAQVVSAAHVETASGMLLTDDYLRRLAEATHEAGGLFVLDCVASGPLWVNMREIGVDILISAPQKGWSGTPCAGYVMLSEQAREAIEHTETSSFAMDLKKWLGIADGYAEGRHGYHVTMPTDSLLHNLRLMREAKDLGLDVLRVRQIELGEKIRAALSERGFSSVAAPGWQAPSVVVVATDDPDLASGKAFLGEGLQIASGVPLMVDEPEDFASFRIGLFGLDKWVDVDGTVARFVDGLDRVLAAGSRD